VQGIGRLVKQWQEPLPQPAHSHSEHLKRQPTRPLVRQQNHSPVVVQPSGHPPPCTHVLHEKPMFSQTCRGEPHGLHGPPPQPMQPSTAPSDTPVLVRKRPAPREVAPSTLKSCRRDDRFARECAARRVRSISSAPGSGSEPVPEGTRTVGHPSGAGACRGWPGSRSSGTPGRCRFQWGRSCTPSSGTGSRRVRS